jgi:uncharacterized integral membrane protein
MGNLWLKIRVWTKILVAVLALLYVICFVANNSDKVHVWFWFGPKPETTVFWVALSAFLAGVLVAVLSRTTFRTMQQFKQMQARQREAKVERHSADLEPKAATDRANPSADAGVASKAGAKAGSKASSSARAAE